MIGFLIYFPFALVYDLFEFLFGKKKPSEPEVSYKEVLKREERMIEAEVKRVDAAVEREGRRLREEEATIEQGKREEEQARAEAIEQEKRMLESFGDDSERL